jgi:hypothetical protein
MPKTGRRRTAEELRAEPEYKELCALLDKQSDTQKNRLEKALTQQEGGADMEATNDIDSRILELRDRQGLSHPKIAEQLNQEAMLTAKGKPFTPGAVQMRYSRLKKQVSHEPQSCEEIENADEPGSPCEISEPCDTPESIPNPSNFEIPAEWLGPLRKLMREEFNDMLANQAIPAKATGALPPPIPRVKGKRKYQGERATLPGCRIDKVLADRFEHERRRAGVSASEAMQRILWRHFGEPLLSFELEEKAEDATDK